MSLPLTALTRKDVSWSWKEDCERSFQLLKEAICREPVLHIIDLSPEGGALELHTDASDRALAGVLFQWVKKTRKPCAFYSRKFSETEARYSTTDRELLGIVACLKHFRHYLQGLSFKVFTDHEPLTYFFSQTNLNKR